MRQVLLLTFLLTTYLSSGQTRTITGKVVDEFDLEPIPEVRIQNRDTVLLGTTDKYGDFKVELPGDQRELLLSWIGMEWTSVELSMDCDKVEIIMLVDGTYDYNSSKKVDRVRKERFNEIPKLHSKAIAKGIFTNNLICYERNFFALQT